MRFPPRGHLPPSCAVRAALALTAALALAGCPEPEPAPSPSPPTARPDPRTSPSPAASPSPTPSPAATPSPAPSKRPSPAPSAAPSPAGPVPEGTEGLTADQRRAWERGRTALVVDLVVRAKSFERGWEAVVPFLPEMRGAATQAFLGRVQDPDPRAKERCLMALAEMARLRLIPDEARAKATEAVAATAKGDTSQPAWAAAIRAYAALAGVDAGKDVCEALGKVGDEAGVVVRACADVLGDLGYRQAAPALVQAADRVQDHFALRALLRALGRVGGPEATERLKRALASSDALDREAAVGALGESAGPVAAAALRGEVLKRDEEASVRTAAVAALERMGGEDARQALEACLAELKERHEDVLVQDVTGILERLKRK